MDFREAVRKINEKNEKAEEAQRVLDQQEEDKKAFLNEVEEHKKIQSMTKKEVDEYIQQKENEANEEVEVVTPKENSKENLQENESKEVLDEINDYYEAKEPNSDKYEKDADGETLAIKKEKFIKPKQTVKRVDSETSKNVEPEKSEEDYSQEFRVNAWKLVSKEVSENPYLLFELFQPEFLLQLVSARLVDDKKALRKALGL